MASEPQQPLAAAEVNPYQTPQSAERPAQVVRQGDAPSPTASEPLRFWEGRKALLKSLFYMRCFALVTALMTLRAGYLLVELFVRPDGEFWNAPGMSFADPWMALSFLASVLILLLTLAMAYVVWRYAHSLQQVVSRREPNPTELCQQHLLLWRLKVALIAAALLQQGVYYIQERVTINQIEAMASE